MGGFFSPPALYSPRKETNQTSLFWVFTHAPSPVGRVSNHVGFYFFLRIRLPLQWSGLCLLNRGGTEGRGSESIVTASRVNKKTRV